MAICFPLPRCDDLIPYHPPSDTRVNNDKVKQDSDTLIPSLVLQPSRWFCFKRWKWDCWRSGQTYLLRHQVFSWNIKIFAVPSLWKTHRNDIWWRFPSDIALSFLVRQQWKKCRHFLTVHVILCPKLLSRSWKEDLFPTLRLAKFTDKCKILDFDIHLWRWDSSVVTRVALQQ